MKKLVALAARLVRAVQKTLDKKWAFLGAFFMVFLSSVGVLAVFDLLPNPPAPKLVEESQLMAGAGAAFAAEEPVRLEIPAVDIDTTVLNPKSTKVADLDAALLSGTVRYPSSSNLGEPGNVIIFGHSSYLPVVNNPAFKAFNGIQNLKVNDEIMVYGTDRVYVYAVDTVEKVDADAAALPLAVEGQRLTLATCDSFGTKSSRFVVTAHLVGSNPIGS